MSTQLNLTLAAEGVNHTQQAGVQAGVIERSFVFDCAGELSSAVVSLPATEDTSDLGVLVIVGGPQYRIGSHRQFVLLSRALASGGVPTMRFDYRGMGDCAGTLRGFEHVDEDIVSAINAFQGQCPHIKKVVLWGLCDAASAALFYAWRDARVSGLVLLNPWVRTAAGEARAVLKHYYLQRLFSRELLFKILRGQFAWRDSFTSLWQKLMSSRQSAVDEKVAAGEKVNTSSTGAEAAGLALTGTLPERMATGLERFKGNVMLVLSGQDLTAAEFRDTCNASARWRTLLANERVQLHDLPDATHTFSRAIWRDEVARLTLAWCRSQR